MLFVTANSSRPQILVINAKFPEMKIGENMRD
jgi:hypothetical protein